MTRFNLLTIAGVLQFFLAILFLCSCNKQKDGFSLTENGLHYKFIKSSKGIKPAPGDIMEMKIIYKTPNDSILFDSKTKSDSFTVVFVNPTFQGGIEEGFAMMSPGDSAIFKASADSIFEKTFHSVLPDYLKPGNLITFYVKLERIITKSIYDSLQLALDIELRRSEFDRIEDFLEKNNMDVMPTENGVYLMITKQGTGDFPQTGDTVLAAYTGRLLDGTVFDQSIEKNAPFKFVIGKNMVIQGWEDCMPLLNKGAVARMVVPSDLGYGAKAYGKLPGYSTLVFDVEIIDVKSGGLTE